MKQYKILFTPSDPQINFFTTCETKMNKQKEKKS